MEVGGVMCCDVCAWQSKRQLIIQRRGATLALLAIARLADANLQLNMPSFWDAIFGSLNLVSGKLNSCCLFLKSPSATESHQSV